MNALISQILANLCERGYHYEPVFGSGDDGGRRLVGLARALGNVFVGPAMDPQLPVLTTNPAADAPDWRPFDRSAGIGWHNDFSTLPERPALSLAWIARPDPEPGLGAWRAASCTAVLEQLRRDTEASTDPERLRLARWPFGYHDSGKPSHLPLVAPLHEDPGRVGLRYYGRALREGAVVSFDRVPAATEQLITLIEGAADAVGETLDATRYALLVCHNGLGLHDRTSQTTASGLPLRRSILCFVSTLHAPGVSELRAAR
jgi:hypothetical protein